MSNLKIAFPDTQLSALDVVTSEDYSTFHPVRNALTGRRHNVARMDDYDTALNIDFDQGSGNTSPIEYLIIARADKLVSNGDCDVTLIESTASDYASGNTTLVNAASLDAATLYGMRSEDYITTFSESTGTRYQRLSLADSGNAYFMLSKIYFGRFFDFDVELHSYDYDIAPPETATLNFPTGEVRLSRASVPRMVWQGVWQGVSDAKVQEFMSSVVDDTQRNYVFLYAPSSGNDEILAGKTLIHAKVMSESISIVQTSTPDWNIVSAAFEENIG